MRIRSTCWRYLLVTHRNFMALLSFLVFYRKSLRGKERCTFHNLNIQEVQSKPTDKAKRSSQMHIFAFGRKVSFNFYNYLIPKSLLIFLISCHSSHIWIKYKGQWMLPEIKISEIIPPHVLITTKCSLKITNSLKGTQP